MTADPTNRQVEPFTSLAEDAPLPKLSAAQRCVMKWLGKKWETAPGAGTAILVNGKRLCNVDTVHALERLGLVEQIELDGRKAVGRWRATLAGRALTQRLGL